MSASAPLDKRGQFIKPRKREVFAALSEDLDLLKDGDGAERLFQLLTATIHYEYLAELEELHDAFHALDPANKADPDIREAAYEALIAGLERVLKGANFAEIDEDEMTRAGTEAGRVRTPVKTGGDDFRSIRLFNRGHHREDVEHRKWWGLRRERVTLDVYDELILFAAMKPGAPLKGKRKGKRQKRRKSEPRPGSVMIKLFHDVAAADLDVVLPGVRVVMTTGDKLMLTVPALIAGIPLLIKLAPAFFVLYGLLRFYFGDGQQDANAIGEALIVASGVVALGGFLMNQWVKYERRSLRYQVEVNDTIYFHNVTNNVGIFDHIIGTAEEQDCKEALLAYFFLLTARAPMTEPELDRTIEAWLDRRFAIRVDFEVDDALRKLERFGILQRSGELLSVKPLAAALGELDGRWDGFFQYAQVA
jgi:hypothetical protein